MLDLTCYYYLNKEIISNFTKHLSDIYYLCHTYLIQYTKYI